MLSPIKCHSPIFLWFPTASEHKKALEDDNELFVAEQHNPNKWAKKVQGLYKGNDGKLKFHEQDGVDPDIKEMTLMEYQADLKEKKDNKKE